MDEPEATSTPAPTDTGTPAPAATDAPAQPAPTNEATAAPEPTEQPTPAPTDGATLQDIRDDLARYHAEDGDRISLVSTALLVLGVVVAIAVGVFLVRSMHR